MGREGCLSLWGWASVKREVVGSVCVVCKRQQTVKLLQGERSFVLLFYIRCLSVDTRGCAPLCVPFELDHLPFSFICLDEASSVLYFHDFSVSLSSAI